MWRIYSVIILLAVSGLTALGDNTSPLNPLPFYYYFAALLISYWVILLVPVIYIFEMWLLARRKGTNVIVLVMAVCIAILNVIDILMSYESGIKYRGYEYINTLIIENFVIFFLAILFAALSMIKRSELYMQSANFLIFFALCWCAFPYIGEMA